MNVAWQIVINNYITQKRIGTLHCGPAIVEANEGWN